MDFLETKSRIAEALVESIFRRARYRVRLFRNDQSPLRIGREDFSPDFCVVHERGNGNGLEHLVEVKYRPSISQFLAVEQQRGVRSVFQLARRQWPELYFVFVTDRPEPGRSCFQAIPFAMCTSREPLRTVDLATLGELGLFPHNIADHERLVQRIFELLAEA